MNSKTNKLHERALRLVYDDRQSTLEKLIKIDKSVTIHHRNVLAFATELHKVHYGLALELRKNIFKRRDVRYNFRNNSTFEARNLKSAFYGAENIGTFTK